VRTPSNDGSGPALAIRPRSRERPLGLDTLSAHWRLAFDAAHDALSAVTRCKEATRFAPEEMRDRAALLLRERAETASLLDAIASEEHVRLVHRLSAPRASRGMLGLPSSVLAVVFDLDGVLTASSVLHAAAWEETFDELLAARAERSGERFAPFIPFNRSTDYAEHLHGRPRLDGVRRFLTSRGLRLPEGAPDDPPGAETVHGLANRKNQTLRRRLAHEGVAAFEGSRRYIEAAREAGLGCAVVSASANTAAILESAGLAELVDAFIDGNVIRAEGLEVKPEPDTLTAICGRLGVEPEHAAAFETTPAGVAAGRTAGFGLVVGVNRTGRPNTLVADGADRVVFDLDELLDPALRG
jgi:HAD superfamily hydrolase (TIGR01509 family)